VAAPCARLQLMRGPLRKCGRGRPFNTIVRLHVGTIAPVLMLTCLFIWVVGANIVLERNLRRRGKSLWWKHLSLLWPRHFNKREWSEFGVVVLVAASCMVGGLVVGSYA
jgi:hypothetical protein